MIRSVKCSETEISESKELFLNPTLQCKPMSGGTLFQRSDVPKELGERNVLQNFVTAE